MLVAELDHRVKNVLARVGVIAMCTLQGSSTMEELVQALDRRIQSMAVAHGGSVDLAFSSAGVCCTIAIPLRTGMADIAQEAFTDPSAARGSGAR